MSPSEIVVGKAYFGRNGSIRVVLSQDWRFTGDLPRCFVRWQLVKQGPRKTGRVGDEGECSRQAFARWATMPVDQVVRRGRESIRKLLGSGVL